ncbi:MAG TPA: ABC transporter permease [Anaerolineaceae bacterium]|nr:ABC transporter permease [Anaerolineaceae bacterium]
MKAVNRIAKRIFTLFFRDRSAIFYTFLATGIMIAVYLFFLDKAFFSEEQLQLVPELAAIQDSWLMAGIAMITSFSASFTALSQMPVDQRTRAFDDFLVAPIRRGQIVAGYILGSTATAFVISLGTVALTYVYLAIKKLQLPGIQSTLLIAGITLLTTLVASGIAFFVASGKNSIRSYGSISSIMLTLIGFFAGAYIPYGALGKTVQTLMSWLPTGHAVGLMRQQYLRDMLQGMNLPSEFDLPAFRVYFGIDIEMLGKVVNPWASVAIILIWALIMFGLGIFRIQKQKE